MADRITDIDEVIPAYRKMLANMSWWQRGVLWLAVGVSSAIAEVFYRAEQGVSWIADRGKRGNRRA